MIADISDHERMVAGHRTNENRRQLTMTKKARPPDPGSGRWRITWMDQWDQDFVDAEVEGFFEFGSDNLGSFQFGYVKGDIDYRVTERDGKPSIEFSFEGHDEMDPALGRGWAVVNGEEIDGMILFHRGDESRFKARSVKRK
jgi:hypothetical protein